MKQLSLALVSVVMAAKRESESTSVTLIADGITKLIYTYNTLIEDDTYYLVGDL
jgi:hypothetical protein